MDAFPSRNPSEASSGEWRKDEFKNEEPHVIEVPLLLISFIDFAF